MTGPNGQKPYTKALSRNLRIRTQIRPYKLPERKHRPQRIGHQVAQEFSTGTMGARRQWNNAFGFLKENYFQP